MTSIILPAVVPSPDVLSEEEEQLQQSSRLSPLTLTGKKRFRFSIPSSASSSRSSSGASLLETPPTLILPRSPKKARLSNDEVTAGIGKTAALLSSMLPLEPSSSTLLSMVPEDVVGHVLGFLGSLGDRYSLQCTSRQFRRLSNSEDLLTPMKLGGHQDSGKGSIFQDDDTIDSAVAKVSIFARAGNLEALYMLGMIKTYCQPDVEGGILILKRAATDGFVRAHYTLGLVLRDSHPDEAALHMQLAAQQEYLPALQELLPNRDMKLKYGELSADQLRPYLDPIGLNRLLGRHYINSTVLRELNTSHCWNPLCGRWAFKAQMVPPSFTEASFHMDLRVSRMKMCSRCCRAKYCSKLCQVHDWRSGRHKTECQFL
eukprot:CAMPEP_0119006678 /NCGR_PEP_ID=MMETSP1176-20130426/2456_1 /TAXON_ID=265551 /ORGANISM="Synedropsis recta cf, Strain CCMP1620" /LENGTH=372 /DNA_ID=CAMNT_0006958633 /DNA_START=100 /DNA_END=1218 /DNA_ORIENTATION=-